MTTRRGPGVFTTILMLVPMLAIPVMALFGVPHFMPVVASPTPHPRSEPFVGFREMRTGQSDTVLRPVSLQTQVTNGGRSVDLFQPYGSAPTSVRSTHSAMMGSPGDASRGEWSDPLNSKRNSRRPDRRSRITQSGFDDPGSPTFDRVPVEDDSETGLVTIFDSRPGRRKAQPSTNAQVGRYERAGNSDQPSVVIPPQKHTLTWRQASRILGDLGVQTYSLSPGQNPGEFRFVCLVTSIDDPRISRRFESNSADPLMAVEQVIGQVKRWTQTGSH